MRKKMSFALSWILPVISLSFPLASLAVAVGPTGGLPDTPITNITGVTGAICTLAGFMFIILIVLAIAFGIYAAFLYLTAGGDEEKFKKANHQLIYIVIAVAVALIAKGLPTIVGSFLGSPAFGTCP